MSILPPTPRKTIAIVGAGITGLQTALSILSSPSSATPPSHSKIIIIAHHLPGDESIEYTSPWAGGHWRSHAHAGGGEAEAELRDWDERTYTEWRRLLASSGGKTREDLEKELGLGVRESIMFWSEETDETGGKGGEGLWWRDVVSGFRVLSQDELAQAQEGKAGDKIVFGARYDTVCVNVPRYLEYLKERIVALGGVFVRDAVRTSGGVEGVVEDVQRIVAAHDSSEPQTPTPSMPAQSQGVEALVLATGLLSRSFLPTEEASKLYPVRGQTVLVKGEAPRAVTHLFPGGEIGYVIPRPGSGTTILGGCKEVDNWDKKEDLEITEKILGRARGLAPELLVGGTGGNGKGEFEVLSVQVGRRPGRKGGPRVEVEDERVKGVRVVYAYGHEGAGYQNSVGSAEKVVRLLAQE
jgi:D-amino-acid oxidase